MFEYSSLRRMLPRLYYTLSWFMRSTIYGGMRYPLSNW